MEKELKEMAHFSVAENLRPDQQNAISSIGHGVSPSISC
jgi:hypothetical protein